MHAGQHFAQENAEGEEVGPGIGIVTERLFGRHVVGCADSHTLARQGCLRPGARHRLPGARRLPGQAEIHHLRAPLPREHHVGRFQVPVHQLARVRGAERFRDFGGNAQALRERQRSGRQTLMQRLAVDELHHDEEPRRIVEELEHLADEWIVEGRGGQRLAAESFPGDRVAEQGRRAAL